VRLATLFFIFLQVSSLIHAATPQKRTPFYRVRTNAPPKPRQANEPVVVNAASFEPGVSPGGLVTVFGQDLTDIIGTVVANSNPWPFVLAGVSVDVNGNPAALFSVAHVNGQDQISFQVPWETPTGPGAADVTVFDNGSPVAEIQADSFTEDPGIFAYNGNFAVAQRGRDGSLIGPDNPAIAGEVLVLYTTGLGPVDLDLTDGESAPSNPLAHTEDPFQVLVDGEQCQVFFSGLAPGFVGLYQVNLVLPGDLRSGALPMQIVSPFSNSATVTLPVR
jgi:uncharacterized protein (TIGR03437 family)